MSPAYLLVVARGGSCAALARKLVERSGLALGYSSEGIAALVGPSCPCLAIDEKGCLLGALFGRDGPAKALATFSADQARGIAKNATGSLLKHYWGSYIAAVRAHRSWTIFRDPSGNFPCYFVDTPTATIFSSDAELLVRSGVAGVSIDLEEIGRQLYRAFVPRATTALRGVQELLAGFAIRISTRGSELQQWWDPWDFARAAGDDHCPRPEELAWIIQQTAQASASPYQRPLLSVSGGLDSSIVAACLARAGAQLSCLTMFTDDPAGDERQFARALCHSLGLPLIERPYRLEDIDLDQPMAPNLPRPKDRLQALAFERTHEEVAAEIGADAFVTGNGGDHVFGYSQSAAPIADRYLVEGLSRGTFASLIDVCRQTGCSMQDAVRQAWSLVRSDCRYSVRPNPLLLHPEFVGGLDSSDWLHPWLDAPPGILPGKAAHVATILRVQPNLEPSLGTRYPVLNPLVSQPVVEACLKVPSWIWRERGRDRAFVRRAFAGALPGLVVDRRVKGTPGRFAARLLDHFRNAIRERLLSGWLARSGVIDAAALENILLGERPIGDLERVRILELVNVEAWASYWISRSYAFELLDLDVTPVGRGPPPA